MHREYFDRIVQDNAEGVVLETRVWDILHTAGDFAFEYDFDGSQKRAYLEGLPQYMKDGYNYLITYQTTYSQEEYQKFKEECAKVQMDFGEIDLWTLKQRTNE